MRNKVQIKEKDVYLCIIEAKEDAFGVCSGSGIEQNSTSSKCPLSWHDENRFNL